MWTKALFWILSACGFIIGFSLGTRGDFLGLVGLVTSNGLVLAAFTLSIITRARETSHKPDHAAPQDNNSPASSLPTPPETDSDKE